VDAAGNLYIADSGNNRIRKITPSGTITTVAGNGEGGFSGDGGPATSAMLDDLIGVAVDAAGNLYIAGKRVRKVTPGGTITTVAGNGQPALGMGADGGPAASTSLDTITGVAVDAAGNLYIAQFGGYIRKVTPGGTITTVAGGNGGGFSGDGGLATSAGLRGPSGVAVDAAGNLYIADAANSLIRKVATKAPFTVNHVIKFAPGTEGQRAALKKMAVVGGMVDGDFVTANEDLNDDGSKEIIVMSHSGLNCGTGGCTTVVLQKRPNGIAIIFEQNVFEPLAVTNEKIGIYRALAIADDKGGIVIGDKRGTPMFGKQLVYPMNGH
jgi:NHL repeat